MLIMLSARYTRQVLMPGKKAWLLRKLKKTSMNYQIQPDYIIQLRQQLVKLLM